MITGSHNPSRVQRLQTVCGASHDHGEAIQEIRRIIERAISRAARAAGTTADVVTPYVDEIAAQFHSSGASR